MKNDFFLIKNYYLPKARHEPFCQDADGGVCCGLFNTAVLFFAAEFFAAALPTGNNVRFFVFTGVSLGLTPPVVEFRSLSKNLLFENVLDDTVGAAGATGATGPRVNGGRTVVAATGGGGGGEVVGGGGRAGTGGTGGTVLEIDCGEGEREEARK